MLRGVSGDPGCSAPASPACTHHNSVSHFLTMSAIPIPQHPCWGSVKVLLQRVVYTTFTVACKRSLSGFFFFSFSKPVVMSKVRSIQGGALLRVMAGLNCTSLILYCSATLYIPSKSSIGVEFPAVISHRCASLQSNPVC